MKKFKILAIAILIGCTSLFASTTETDPVIPIAMLRAQIIDLLPPGDFGTIKEQLVRIHFTYNSNGEIVILKIGIKNQKIKKYVSKNLNHKSVRQPGEVGKLYYLPLKITHRN